jgi:hypothetical protein
MITTHDLLALLVAIALAACVAFVVATLIV